MITTETTPVINDDNNTITTLSEVDNTLSNPDNMITEVDNTLASSDNKVANTLTETDNMITDSANTLSETDNMITEVDNTLTDSANKVDNTLTNSDNTLTDSDNIDNTLTDSDNNLDNNANNIDNSLVTPVNTVLQNDNNLDNTVITVDNEVGIIDNAFDNIGNTPINNDNTDVSKLEKFYGIRLKGASVHKIETQSSATGVKPTNYVTALIEAQLSETAPTIDLDKIRADERQKCAAQQAEMMKLYIPRATHEAEINALQSEAKLQDEKYGNLYKEATRLFKELATANQKLNNLPKEKFPTELEIVEKLEVININDFQEILSVIIKVFVKNRFVDMQNIHALALNLFNQTIAQKS